MNQMFHVEFYMPDEPAFWAGLTAAARNIDLNNQGAADDSYSQTKAFAVCFLYDGFDTIYAVADEAQASRADIGWTIEHPNWTEM